MRTTKAALALGILVLGLLAASVPCEAQFTHANSGTVTSNYYSSRPYGIHGALDIAGPSGIPIWAAYAGTVTFRGWSGGYGNLMIVTHSAGYSTYYAHLSAFVAGSGASVGQKQHIAKEGTTGHSTGPHLHFEIRRYGTKLYLPGSVGNSITRGTPIAHTYAGLGASSGGGSSGGGDTSGGTYSVKVTTSTLNVRTGPGTGYSIKGTVGGGQFYFSIARSGDWHKIWYDGGTGWCHGGYLTKAGSAGVTVTTDALNVRTGPGTGYGKVGLINSGQKYARITSSSGWHKIWFKGGAYWVYGGYTSEF